MARARPPIPPPQMATVKGFLPEEAWGKDVLVMAADFVLGAIDIVYSMADRCKCAM